MSGAAFGPGLRLEKHIHAGKLLIHIRLNVLWQNHSASFYLILFKFGTLKDIFVKYTAISKKVALVIHDA